MSQILAFASAVMFGLGDFTGGFTTRRISVWTVMMWSSVFGAIVLAVGLLVVPAESVTTADLAFGAVGGLAGFIGLVILYTALARGTMSLVAPITGATGAVVPVVFDLGTGGRLTGLEWTGVVLGIGAIALLGADVSRRRVKAKSFFLALTAGATFAVFFIALAQTNEASGLWPVAAARGISIPLAAIIALAVGAAARPRGHDAKLVATAGTLDMAANVSVVLALQRGSLSVSTVLSSLYPAFTVLAAVVVLHERPGATQIAGIGLALGAVIALAV